MKRGFTLVEVLVGSLVSVILWSAFSVYVGALMEATRVPAGTYSHVAAPSQSQVLQDGVPFVAGGSQSGGWSYYERAPSIEATRRANLLFADFMEVLDAADFVVVLGGGSSYPLPRDGETLRSNMAVMQPTKPGAFLGVTGYYWGNLDPRVLSNSYAVRQVLNQDLFADFSDPSGSFVVLCFRGFGDLISATECYRKVDQGNVYYSVQHYREPKNNGQLNGEGLLLHSYYRFYLPVADEQWALPVGATHYWYRYDGEWQRFEEAPCRVIFPDPYLLASTVGTQPVKPFSRFAFFVDPIK